ncbi:hypothetical protein MPSEU_000142200 [Mayamaea pseudoterrestris]|nr:hypothetical protein MPSEU_000142200 [Mayamaea pseudoterrestris]
MEEEPWDESVLGKKARSDSFVPPDADGLDRTDSLGKNDYSNEDAYSGYEDGQYEEDAAGEVSSSPQDIRQEALKILELAESPTGRRSQSTFAVHRTSTGGYTTGISSEASMRHTPAALSGSLFTTNRTSAANTYRDDMSSRRPPWQAPTTEDMEYGDEELVDAISKVYRTDASNNWSSRYSLDRTMAAMMASNKNINMRSFRDNGTSERTSATGLTASSAYDKNVAGSGAGNSNIFGSGFSFRQNSVWGKQNAVFEPNANLHDAGDQLPDLPTRKSWQEQVRQRKKQRRCLIFVAIAVLVFIVTISATVARKNNKASEVPLTIYVTSDVPYAVADQKKFIHDLGLIKTKANYIVHLGNIQNVSETNCGLAQYMEVAAMLEETKIPTFIVPGEDDWANCPDQHIGFARWNNTFAKFAHKTGSRMKVDYQQRRLENFAFVEKNVLFLSVHVIGGKPTTYSEFLSRMKDNMNWIRGMYKLHAEEVSGVVIFGNAAPGLVQLQDFFDSMASLLGPTGKTVLYIHSNSGSSGVSLHKPFGYSNMVTIQAPVGGKQPPLPISIGSGKHLFSIGGLDVPYRSR